MPKLEGTISMSRLPPKRGLIVNLCFFAVAGPDAPAPYGGDPPAEAATDCDKVFEQVDLQKESQENVTLPVEWPQIPLEDLHHYGTVSPQNKRPWWKFW